MVAFRHDYIGNMACIINLWDTVLVDVNKVRNHIMALVRTAFITNTN